MKINISECLSYLKKSKNILISLLIGSLVGSAITFLFSPQSGRQIRDQIYQKSIRLFHRPQMKNVSADIN